MLQRDPAGVYGAHGLPEPRPLAAGGRGAGRADRRGAGARGAASGRERAPGGGERRRPTDRAAHVGYHLIGRGPRATSRADVALPAAACATRVRRFVLAPRDRASTSASIALADRRCCVGRGRRVRAAHGALAVALAGVGAARCCCRRASSRSRSCSGWWPRCVAPRRLPRLDFSDGVPDERADDGRRPDAARRASAASTTLLEHLEVLALGNLDPRIHFAILSDFADAAARDAAGRRGDPRPRARRHRGAQRAARRRARRPLLPVPPRAAVERRASGVWMGWERKRGKIEEFNRLLRGATDTSFTTQVGDARRPAARPLLHHARLATRACRATPREKLIGIIAHPLNRPRFDPALRPRHRGLRHPAAARQRDDGERRRLAVRARSTPATPASIPYTTAVSDTYQDLFGEGIFTGKGLYDVDAFMTRARRPRARERAAVARPVRGPLRAHGARHRRRGRGRLSRRASSRTRGGSTAGCAATGRSCGGCSRACRRAPGCERNRLPLIARWKILDNLRRSLVRAGDARRCSSLGWTVLPGQPARLDGRRRWRRSSFPLCSRAARAARAGRAAASRGACSCARLRGSARPTLARVALQLDVPRQPGLGDGCTRSASRWCASASRSGGCSSGRRRRRAPRARRGPAARARSSDAMMREPAHRAGVGARRRRGRCGRRRCRSPLPILALWAAAPSIALRAEPPGAVARGASSTPRTARSCAASRAKTWRYFETFVGADGPLAAARQRPGDARSRASRTARRRPTSAWACSPTLAAHDLGFIDADDAGRRGSRRRSTTIEGLERHEGHLLNWYDTRDPGAAAAALRLDRGQRQPRRRAGDARAGAARARRERRRAGRRGLRGLAARADAFVDAMNFRFLYDPQRQLFAIGYRLADAEGPGAPRRVVLRPARLRGAAGELPRHRQGRRARDALVPPRPARSPASTARRCCCRGARRCSST